MSHQQGATLNHIMNYAPLPSNSLRGPWLPYNPQGLKTYLISS